MRDFMTYLSAASQMRCMIAGICGCAAALLFSAAAAQGTKIYKVGVLSDDATPRFQAFRQGMRELGYIEGRNLVLETRFNKGNAEALPALAAELVRSKPDVILATSSIYDQKTAKALGLVIARAVFLRADEIIA
ncbi:MAG: hypothetical protein ACT4P4_14335 [Betaproteobacteria bacterium]